MRPVPLRKQPGPNDTEVPYQALLCVQASHAGRLICLRGTPVPASSASRWRNFDVSYGWYSLQVCRLWPCER